MASSVRFHLMFQCPNCDRPPLTWSAGWKFRNPPTSIKWSSAPWLQVLSCFQQGIGEEGMKKCTLNSWDESCWFGWSSSVDQKSFCHSSIPGLMWYGNTPYISWYYHRPIDSSAHHWMSPEIVASPTCCPATSCFFSSPFIKMSCLGVPKLSARDQNWSDLIGSYLMPLYHPWNQPVIWYRFVICELVSYRFEDWGCEYTIKMAGWLTVHQHSSWFSSRGRRDLLFHVINFLSYIFYAMVFLAACMLGTGDELFLGLLILLRRLIWVASSPKFTWWCLILLCKPWLFE